jgi:hypothetical protein
MAKGRTRKGKKVTSAADQRAMKTPSAPKPLYQETGDILSISTWAEVKLLFEQKECVFDNKLYCRPFGDPRKYTTSHQKIAFERIFALITSNISAHHGRKK